MKNTKAKIFFLTIFFFALFAVAQSASAADVYLDISATGCTGGGNVNTNYNPATKSCGNGSDKVYAGNYPFEAGRSLNDGDTLYIRAGEYWEDVTGKPGYGWQMGSLALSGKNHILVQNYNSEVVWMKCGDTKTDPGVCPNNAVSMGGSYQTLDISYIYGNIMLSGTNNTVQNCDISGGFDHQSSWNPGQPDAAWPNVIRFKSSINALIKNCYIHDNVRPPDGGNGCNMALFMHEEDQNTIVENCKFENGVGDAVCLKYQYNWQAWQGKYGQGPAGTHATYRYNVIGANTTGIDGSYGYSNKDSYIYQNIFISPSSANLNPNGMDGKFFIYNNDFYNTGADLNRWQAGSAAAIQAFNNIMYHDTPSQYNIYFQALVMDFYTDYNDFYASGTTAKFFNGSLRGTMLGAWQTFMSGTGQDQNSINTNPNFLNASGNFNLTTDFKRSLYSMNGRGGSWPSVMGAYITGSETIGLTSGTTPDTTPPSAPSGLAVN